MPPKKKTVYCPVCKALNASGRKTCDLCGSDLSATVTETATAFACRNCGSSLNGANAVCGRCGRVGDFAPDASPEVPTPAMSVGTNEFAPGTLVPVPYGFAAERLPEGRLRVTRTVWGRMNADISYVVIGLVVGAAWMGIAYRLWFPAGNRTVFFAFFPWILLPVLAVGWFLFYREEWIVGPQFLEKRMFLLGWHRAATLSGPSVLRTDTEEIGGWSRSGPRRVRVLSAVNLGRRITLVRSEQAWGGIASLFGSGMEGDGPATLGAYLSQVTGWPYMDPAMGKF
ncbi:MAG: zinc ribbon domain-containing protein [Capsulimonadales bacterium]|nr:zinc ribbon domain-containing protein [Capsulimonadales bacterium]